MAIKFNELEKALYHIRVNYFFCDTDNLSVQIYGRGNGDTVIAMLDEKTYKKVGEFFLSEVFEEITLLQQGKIDLCDLSANNVEWDEEN
jgi:hypothetical protein